MSDCLRGNDHKLKPWVERLYYNYTLYTCNQFLLLDSQTTIFLNFWHNIIYCWLFIFERSNPP
jgi:hypothetical protein